MSETNDAVFSSSFFSLKKIYKRKENHVRRLEEHETLETDQQKVAPLSCRLVHIIMQCMGHIFMEKMH